MKTYLLVAMSVDGFIAKDLNTPSTSWTSKADRKFFQKKSKELKVIVMGEKTYKTFNKPLKERINIIYTHSKQKLRDFDIEKISVQGGTALYYTDLQPKKLLTFLSSKGFQTVAICGGQTIYSLFMREGLVNYLYLTMENKIFGQGLKLFNCDLDVIIKLLKMQELDSGVLVLKYEVERKKKSVI